MNLLGLLSHQIPALRSGEETPVEADWPEGREELWLLLAEAETLVKAAIRVRDTVKAQLAGTIQENEKVRLGQMIYDVTPSVTTRISDPKAFKEWLADDLEHVIPVTPTSRILVGGLKAVCARRDVDYWTIRNTFFESEQGELGLRAVPVDRAPKYAQKLSHGESTFGRTR